MAFTAQATTDSLGRITDGGFDLTNLQVQLSGEQIDPWDREVSLKGSATLEQILTNDKLIKYDLIASILANDEKVPLDTVIEMYACGAIKELRIGKKRFRLHGTNYLGCKKQ